MKKTIIIAMAAAALAFGCGNLFTQKSSSPSSSSVAEVDKQGKTATVSFVVSNPNPATSKAAKKAKSPKGITIAFVTVTASRSGSSDIVANLTYNASTNTSTGTMTGLDLGQWTFLGQATDSLGNVLFSGQTIYTVVSGTNSISLDLYENIGAIKVVAGWELAGGFTDLVVTASRDTFPTVSAAEAVSASVTGSFAYLINLTAGDWSVSATGSLNGTIYFQSAPVTVTVTENAIATQSVPLPQIKVTPVVASPDAGTYSTAQTIALSTITSQASIYYRSDGGDPGADLATAQANSSATLYSSAISVGQNETITARAYSTTTGSGIAPTDETSLAYLIQAAAPNFSLGTGTYTSNQTITITTALSGATIRYTTDNSVPTDSNGSNYSSPIIISGDSTGQTAVTTHLKAIVIKSGCAESPVTSADYTITGTCAAPTMTPDSGSYAAAQTITMATTTPSAAIRYTTGDGTQVAPTETTGTLYSAPFTISHNTTIKAIAYLATWADSSVTTKTYTLDLTYTTLSSASQIKGALEGYLKMTAANSPYHIGANVAVDTGTILFIEPGVTVKFDGNYYLRVDGTMIANGTSSSHILFTSNQTTPKAGDWDSVRLNSATDEVSYCDFYYSGAGGLEINASFKVIDSCNFVNSSLGTMLGCSSVTFENCTFTSNSVGINVNDNLGSAEFENCIFNGNGTAVYASGSGGEILLKGCSISSSVAYGIVGDYRCNINIQQCDITGNAHGIEAGSMLGIWGGSISMNQSTLTANSGGGIIIQSGSFSVSNCNLEDASAVVNNSTSNYDLSNNYWGITDEATIQGMIYDYYDNISYGKVNYTPWLTQAVTW
jgi:hypothetical protein